MSHDAAIGMVHAVLAKGVNLRYLYVDTVGDQDRYQAKLAELFPSLKVVVEKKADSTFPVVSAASICAKVPRDRILHGWQFEDEREPRSPISPIPNPPRLAVRRRARASQPLPTPPPSSAPPSSAPPSSAPPSSAPPPSAPPSSAPSAARA
jgi:hypothetical protein